MTNSPLIFLIGGVIFLLWGLSALRSEEVYLGRLIRFVGPKLVLKSRIAVLIYGGLIALSGALTLVVGIAKVLDPDTALVDQLMPPTFLVFGIGFFGSMIVELFLYASELGPYGDVDPADVADRYRGRGS